MDFCFEFNGPQKNINDPYTQRKDVIFISDEVMLSVLNPESHVWSILKKHTDVLCETTSCLTTWNK